MQMRKASTCQFGRFMCRSLAVSVLCVAIVGCQTYSEPVVNDLTTGSKKFASRFYAGASYGQSWLEAQAGSSQTAENSGGTQLRLGFDVHNRLALEFDTATFGVTQFRDAFVDDKYSSSTISALVYGLNGVNLRSRREGLSAYARLGFGTLNTDAVVDQLKFSDALPVAGLGAEFGFANGLSLRAELTRYDQNTLLTGIGVVYRFGASGIESTMVESTHEPQLAAAEPVHVSTESLVGNSPVLSPEHLLVEEQQQLLKHTLADRWRPVARPDDGDSDGVLDDRDECPSTDFSVTVGSNGCGLFDGVLSEVTFATGSHLLTTRARAALDQVAQTLLAFPEARIEVRAHTDSEGRQDSNLAHSVRRAEAIVLYLQSRGVNPLQLQSLGMGESNPIASNDSEWGRLKNRRVEVVTLPDRDADTMLPAISATPTIVVSETKKQTPLIPAARAPLEVGHPRDEGLTSSLKAEEPIMQSANSEDELDSTSESVSTKPATVARKQKPEKVTPLPVPGYAPGLNLSGIIKGVDFESGTAVLSEQAQEALQPVLLKLLANPNVSVAIMSHTDDVGEESENANLSIKRSGAVLSFLVKGGVAPDRLQAEGYGESLPLVQNVTAEDRARNRRVEIRVLPSS